MINILKNTSKLLKTINVIILFKLNYHKYALLVQ